jgi:ribosomal protein L13
LPGLQKQWEMILRSAVKSMLPQRTTGDNPHRLSTVIMAVCVGTAFAVCLGPT